MARVTGKTILYHALEKLTAEIVMLDDHQLAMAKRANAKIGTGNWWVAHHAKSLVSELIDSSERSRRYQRGVIRKMKGARP